MELKHNEGEYALYTHLPTWFPPQSANSGNQLFNPIWLQNYVPKIYLYFFYYHYQILNSTNI